MEPSERALVVPRENPRSVAAKHSSMPSATNEKPAATPILDKFRALLRQRQEELLGEDVEDDAAAVAALGTEEVVRVYEAVLSELTFNSKPIITDLTIIAGEQREHGEGIADAICARILKVPADQKLPSLYLLDSIVKNIGRNYVSYFSSRLPEVFCAAYRQVQPNLYPSMRHLFGTWSSVFPHSVLHKIETQLQFSSQASNNSTGVNSLRASESPRPTHGIHVNPKYLRQLEHPNADNIVQHGRGTASDLKLSGQIPAGYDEYDSDHADVMTAQVGTQRLNAIGGNSPRRIPVLDYGVGRAFGRDEGPKEWRRKHYSDDIPDHFGSSIPYALGNGQENQGPRALIDAYGEDRRKKIPRNKPVQIEHLDVNGMGSKVASRSWHNTEEEEFDWEDMSPTLADRGRSDVVLPSSLPPFRGVGTRPGIRRLGNTLQPGIQNTRSNASQMPLVDDPDSTADNAYPLLSGRGAIAKVPQVQVKTNQIMDPRHPQSQNLPHHFPQSTHLLNTRLRGDVPIPFSGSSLSSSTGDILAPVEKSLDTDLQFVRPSSAASRIGSSVDSVTSGTWLGTVMPSSTGLWPPVNVNKSHPLPTRPIFPLQKQIRSQFDPINASASLTNQGVHKPSFRPDLHFTGFESKEKQQLLPNQNAVVNQHNQSQLGPYVLGPPLNRGYNAQGQNPAISMVPSYSVPSTHPLTVNSNPTTLHPLVGIRPPLPPGPPRQMIPILPNASPVVSNPVVYNQSSGGAFSGLISSLVDQGLISLTNQASVQDSLGLEFNADLLKLRHESAISALYADLPRQCTTCGLRFKCQEEHRSHMDWHVTKNRMSKKRKQKPSRKWFVSSSMWLSGAEALGSDAVPGFLPIEIVVEKKDDEELAVPADEEQNTCALCGESFDDFYSDETEEWMYRGAVYLNAPKGSTAGMDKSQLGPIVHAKCRSESDVGPPENFGFGEGGNSEEGSNRKRMRS